MHAYIALMSQADITIVTILAVVVVYYLRAFRLRTESCILTSTPVERATSYIPSPVDRLEWTELDRRDGMIGRKGRKGRWNEW